MPPTLLAPGGKFPSIKLALASGGECDLASVAPGQHKLIVVYRGSFCPFCTGTLKQLEAKAAALAAAGVAVVAVSADDAATTAAFRAAQGLTLTSIAVGLGEAQARQIGVFVSDPTHYIAQKHRFAEPAYFVLNDAGEIRYSCVSSHPMGGRPDVDAIVAGLGWVKQNSIDHPEFKAVTWGSA